MVEITTLHRKLYKFISELKKKNPKWDKITVACKHSTARTLFMEENNDDGFNVSIGAICKIF